PAASIPAYAYSYTTMHLPRSTPLSLHDALPISNGVSLYSAAGEMRSMDASGNSTLLSPQDTRTNEWVFYSKNTVTGQVLKIDMRSEEHTSELQSRVELVCRLLLEKKKRIQ